jgi:hypothetical protein
LNTGIMSDILGIGKVLILVTISGDRVI